MIEPILATYLCRILGALEIADTEARRRVVGQIRRDIKDCMESGAQNSAVALAPSPSKSDNK
jgi:hypothetical protein